MAASDYLRRAAANLGIPLLIDFNRCAIEPGVAFPLYLQAQGPNAVLNIARQVLSCTMNCSNLKDLDALIELHFYRKKRTMREPAQRALVSLRSSRPGCVLLTLRGYALGVMLTGGGVA
jgi:hypothetical protein